jgi:hypothetical protein
MVLDTRPGGLLSYSVTCNILGVDNGNYEEFQ